MKKSNESDKLMKRALVSGSCIAATILMAGGMSACAVRDGGAARHQGSVQPDHMQQETMQPEDMQQDAARPDNLQQETMSSEDMGLDAMPSGDMQQNAKQPGLSGNEQISLEDAKQAALTDAGVLASAVSYTKEKLDYENGITVYDIEFYADNIEYEYEINAATGEVYSKSMDTHQNQTGHGHEDHAGTAETYISAESAETIALDHAGFSAAEVSRLKSEFDFDDGQAVYEVEFQKNGTEYEYKIDAVGGSIIEYDVDH